MRLHKHSKQPRKGMYRQGSESRGEVINKKFGFKMKYKRFNKKDKKDIVEFIT